MRRNLFPFLAGLGCALLSWGCAHYQLGTGPAAGFASLYVAPVSNQSDLPQAAAIVSAQIRDAFLRDGRVSLAGSPDAAGATLTVTLVKLERATLTVLSNDTGLARKFGLTLTATATLRDRTGKVLFADRPLKVERQDFTDSGQQLAEDDTVPLLAKDLADAALHATLDVW